MPLITNLLIDGVHEKPIITDIGYKKTKTNKPVIIFLHGFKGFKDWGHFNNVMQFFINNQFVFIKFNFSFNGGTPLQPFDFPDLGAFGNNNYVKELDDVHSVLNWIENNTLIPSEEIDLSNIFLIGHSRGGGIAIIKASEDSRVKKLVTWAAVSNFINRLPDIEKWKKEGVIYTENTRTKQQMPMYYQFAETLLNNKERLNIEKCEKALSIPHLIIHGTNDEAVHFSEAEKLKEWNLSTQLFLIKEANHTFGISHPFNNSELSNYSKEVLEKTLQFLR
jgi:pimeloyl-ACP methyl ester carboxylesterase